MASKPGTPVPRVKIPAKKKGNQPKVWVGGIFQDGGGFVISFDRTGRISIKPVPPWQPDIARLAVIGSLVQTAQKAKSRADRKQLNILAEQIAADALAGIQVQLNRQSR
jgi:hypothetical protein